MLVFLLFLLVFLLYRQLGIMYLGSAEGVSRDGLDRGTKAPDFTVTDQYGEAHRLAIVPMKAAQSHMNGASAQTESQHLGRIEAQTPSPSW